MRLTSMLFSALVLVSAASAADFTGVGSWKGDVAKFSPKTDFTQFKLTIEQSGPKEYQMMLDVVHKGGEKGDQQFQIICDGKEQPFKLTGTSAHSNRTAVCEQTKSFDLTIRQMEDGKEVTQNKFTISPNGKTMTYVVTESSDNQAYTFILKRQ
jgi:hypothetical protein